MATTAEHGISQATNRNKNREQRKALAPLNIQNQIKRTALSNHGLKLKQSQFKVTAITQEKSENQLCLENQENLPNQNNKYDGCSNLKNQKPAFHIFNENDGVELQGRDQEDILQENIEAVKKELNSFLIDSIEKESFVNPLSANDQIFEEKDNFDGGEVSFMNVDNDDSFDVENQQENCQEESSQLNSNDLNYVQPNTELSVYSEEILLYMLDKERQFMPNPFYMSQQQHVHAKMRSIVVDWLVDVVDEYNMRDETLFLAVNYIDRFLSNFSITRQDFQLLGTSSLFIASKYEEIYPPELEDFVYITDDSYTKEQILAMEKTILNGLSFDVSIPTCNYFLELFSSQLSLDNETYSLAKYLIFLSALEYSPFLKYYPSEIAVSSLVIATQILKKYENILESEFFNKTLIYEKSLGQQGNVIHLLNERNNIIESLNQLRIYASQHPQQAIQKRYSTDKYYNVSKIVYDGPIGL